MESKTKKTLQIELLEMTDMYKEAEKDLKTAWQDLEKEKKDVARLENELWEAEEKLADTPDLSSLLNLMKYELFSEHINSFSLESFEQFIKLKDLY